MPGLIYQEIEWLPFLMVELILAAFTILMFAADRVANRKGEDRILALLNEIAG